MNWYGLAKLSGIQLYHGTSAEFQSFDLSMAGKRDYGDYGLGVYLTPNSSLAKLYAHEAVRKHGGTPIVLKVLANVSKTANMDDPVIIQQVSHHSKAPFPKSITPGQPQSRPYEESHSITESLRLLGYDSVTAREGREFVVFDPSHIQILGKVNLDLI